MNPKYASNAVAWVLIVPAVASSETPTVAPTVAPSPPCCPGMGPDHTYYNTYCNTATVSTSLVHAWLSEIIMPAPPTPVK